MQTATLNGVTVSLSGGLVLRKIDYAPAPAATLRGGLFQPGGGVTALSTSTMPRFDAKTILQEALSEQYLKPVAEWEIAPNATQPPPVRGIGEAPASAPPTAEFQIDIGPSESAALLVEDNGLYRWVFAEDDTPLPPPSPAEAVPGEPSFVRRILPAEPPPARRLTFRIVSGSAPAPTDGPTRRLFLPESLVKPVRVMVFRFVARLAVGPMVNYLEQRSVSGLINMKDADPAKWSLLDSPETLSLPPARPARILLFIHGTFSSTVGSFGCLGATPWGKTLLAGAAAHYDAVLGFNHPTLSVDPLVNATALLNSLRRLFPDGTPPQIDTVAYSRGGLVYRSLTELVLPSDGWKVNWGKTVFVAATNGGTHLGEPQNWQTLVDTYTNLAMQGCTALSLFPQAQAASLVLKEVVADLGALVRALAHEIVDEKLIPGLAAMQPNGDFIKTLNAVLPGQPQAAVCDYYAITSAFATDVPGEQQDAITLPERVLNEIKVRFMDRLMGQDNDLVVDTVSAKAIDLDTGSGTFIKDSFDYGRTRRVYHTVYFLRPEVTRALSHWFGLAEANEATATAVSLHRGLRGLSNPGGQAISELPAAVETDFLLLETALSVREAQRWLLGLPSLPRYLLLRRRYQGQWLFYVRQPPDISNLIPSEQSLLDALNLHESGAAPVLRSSRSIREAAQSPSGLQEPGVALDGEMPVGVIGRQTPPSLEELAALAASPEPSRTSFAPPTRRLNLFSPPTRGFLSPVVPTLQTPPPPPVPPNMNFLAEMPETIVVGISATALVSLSRDALMPLLVSRNTATATATTDESLDIVLQAVPIRNLALVGTGQQRVAPPKNGEKLQMAFVVQGTDVGDAELRIVALQGQVPLCTLVLRPEVAKGQAVRAVNAIAEARVVDAKPIDTALLQLFIFERRNGAEVSFQFLLQAPKLGNDAGVVRLFCAEPLNTDQDAYVNSIYKRIEERWDYSQTNNVAFRNELRAVGAGLFEDLFPKELQQILWENRNSIQGIMVLSYEPFIPWEIVHLRPPREAGKPVVSLEKIGSYFLGDLGLVRWLDGTWPTETLRILPDKVCCLTPKYPAGYDLKAAATEGETLKTIFGAVQPVAPNEAALRGLLSEPGSFDLLHFAGHGLANSDDIQKASLILEVQSQPDGTYKWIGFDATQAAQFSNLWADDGSRSIVVLNACQLGRAGYTLGQLGGFASAFVQAGAGAFVGALWSVMDTDASVFLHAFYANLNAGKTLAEATIAARKEANDADESASCTHLAYTVYGHPQARLRK